MKANLARFMQAIMLLGAMALTLGAGIRWSAVANAIGG